MVYKKYIKRNGKVYGPYVYHSKRVDGKVISEYHGSKNSTSFDLKNYKNFLWIFLGVLVLGVAVFGVLNSDFGSNISGMAVAGLEANYQEGKILEGTLQLNFLEGELVPASSTLVFENSEQVYRFDLSELVSGELVEGDYYVQGNSFDEAGYGYGVLGTKKIYPELSFDLEISYSEVDGSSSSSSGSSTENTEEIQEEPSEEISEESIEKIMEEPQENLTEEIIEEVSVEEIVEETVEEELIVEEPPEEVQDEPAEEIVEETVEEESAEETIETSPITGAVIGNGFSRFFSKFGITGKVTMDMEKTISGTVSGNEDFIYPLLDGQEIDLVSGSVSLDGEILDDSVLSLEIVDGNLVVSTDYGFEEQGFGKEYVGESFGKNLEIDLSSLGLVLQPGNLKTSLIYEDKELVSFETILEEGTVGGEEEEVIVPEEIEVIVNETEDKVLWNETEESEDIFFSAELSEEYQTALIDEFGNSTAQITKTEVYKNRLIVRFELGDFWAEYSYEYEGDLNEEIYNQIEEDKINWLEDIAKGLLNGDVGRETLSKEEFFEQVMATMEN